MSHDVSREFAEKYQQNLEAINNHQDPPVPQIVPPEMARPVAEGQWGFLPDEPCRYCHHTHCVYFLIDEQPQGMTAGQIVRCDHCKRDWEAGGSSA